MHEGTWRTMQCRLCICSVCVGRGCYPPPPPTTRRFLTYLCKDDRVLFSRFLHGTKISKEEHAVLLSLELCPDTPPSQPHSEKKD
jgi:hypothetical protein